MKGGVVLMFAQKNPYTSYAKSTARLKKWITMDEIGHYF